MDKLKCVYNMLEDELSKEIWINRLNYCVTGNIKYLRHMAEKSYGELYTKAKNLDRPVIVYGVGGYAIFTLTECLEIKTLKCFCDRDKEKQEKGFFGFPVISPEELIKNYTNEVIVIAAREHETEIREFLIENGIPKDEILDLKDDYKKFGEIEKKQYFEEEFLSFGGEEVFVDAGCYDLGTSVNMLKKCTEENVKKIYAYEPDKINYEHCLKRKTEEKFHNIEIFPYGTWSKKGELRFQAGGTAGSHLSDEGEVVVPVISIDETVKEKVTFIKMDVEGAELESLKGAKNTILRDKPKLAICIYHKPEDLTEIPLYIKSLVPEYKFYVRHYTFGFWETVLYAVI